MDMTPPGIADIRAAAARIGTRLNRTPLLASPGLDAMAGRPVLVKAESLQLTGSFKARGGWSAVSKLAEGGVRGVMAFSSGNHAQGVAYAAREHGLPATILMPADAPAAKIAGTRALGAEVVTYDRATESREEIGARLAEERGYVLVRPYDEPLVIAGQGTAGLELAAQAAERGLREAEVLVPCGGGGLASGMALALAAEAPGMRVRTVEPEDFDDVARSLAAGEKRRNARLSGSICDAIVTPEPGDITFPLLAAHAGPGLVVTEEEVLRAMGAAFRHLRLVVEPGGAVALAAALFHGAELAGETVIAVASGGNVDPAMFARAMELAPEA
ncbi:threonine ammonia-lyase [Pseudoroseicyclus tamaricis]